MSKVRSSVPSHSGLMFELGKGTKEKLQVKKKPQALVGTLGRSASNSFLAGQ